MLKSIIANAAGNNPTVEMMTWKQWRCGLMMVWVSGGVVQWRLGAVAEFPECKA